MNYEHEAMMYFVMKWRVTHGEPQSADTWLLSTATKLRQGVTLDFEDIEILASILTTAGIHKQGARLFNDMKMPDKRRCVTKKMDLYFAVEKLKAKGEKKAIAVELAAEDCGYYKDGDPEDVEDKAVKRAGNDYKEIQRQYKKHLLETRQELEKLPPPRMVNTALYLSGKYEPTDHGG